MLCDWNGYLGMVAVDILVNHKRYSLDQEELRFVVSGLLGHALVLTVKHGLVIVSLGYALGLIAVLITGLVLSELKYEWLYLHGGNLMCITCIGIII